MATAVISSSRAKTFRVRRGLALSPFIIGADVPFIELSTWTPENEIVFPTELDMNLSNGGVETLPVSWVPETEYNQHIIGVYSWIAEYSVPNYLWPLKPTIRQIVKLNLPLPLASSTHYLVSNDELDISQ